MRIRPICSAPEGFYFQASNGSVALPVAGYDYNSDWTPLLAGLSPAEMAASLAAPEPTAARQRTALTGMARLGIAPIVIGHVANHRTTTKAGITLGVYVQHAYEKEKREALELWSNRLQGIISGRAEGRGGPCSKMNQAMGHRSRFS